MIDQAAEEGSGEGRLDASEHCRSVDQLSLTSQTDGDAPSGDYPIAVASG